MLHNDLQEKGQSKPKPLFTQLYELQILRLIFCVAGIYVFFLTWGVLQERVSTRSYAPDGGHEGIFDGYVVLSVAQSFVAMCVAYIFIVLRGQSIGAIGYDQVSLYTQIGLTSCIGAYCGYSALEYVTFPFIVLVKTSKLVPVVIIQTLLYGRKYPWYKYLSVILITAGVGLFFILKPSKGEGVSTSSTLGIALVVLNLFLDGYTNSTEDYIVHKHQTSSSQLMFYFNLSQTVLLLLFLVLPVSSQLSDSITFLMQYPAASIDILLFALSGALGQTFIFLTLEIFGSVVLVTITVTRKLFTILLSVFLYGHSILPLQWAAVVAVFAGIGLEAVAKELLEKRQGHTKSH